MVQQLLNRQHSIWNVSTRLINGIAYCPRLSDSPALAVQGETKPEFNLKLTDTSNPWDGGWTLVSAWGRKKNVPPSFLQSALFNRYDVLGVGNEEHMSNRQDQGEASHAKLIQLPNCIRTHPTRKIHKVLVIVECLLRGTEAPIGHPDNFSREIFFLPAAHFHVTERLMSLLNPTDYHPLLLVHVGSNDYAMRQLRTIKRDYMLHGAVLKGSWSTGSVLL